MKVECFVLLDRYIINDWYFIAHWVFWLEAVNVLVMPVHNYRSIKITQKSGHSEQLTVFGDRSYDFFFVFTKYSMKNRDKKRFRLSCRSLGQGFSFRSLVQTLKHGIACIVTLRQQNFWDTCEKDGLIFMVLLASVFGADDRRCRLLSVTISIAFGTFM